MRPSSKRGLLVLLGAVATASSVGGTAGAGKPVPPPLPTTVKCSTADLVNAIQKANKTPSADTIILSRGCTYLFRKANSGQSALPAVTAALTIDGNGATLQRDARADPFRLLTVSGWAGDPGFTVENLTFRGGASTSGGAILFGDSANDWTIDGCTFDGNSSSGVGGAIAYASVPGRSLTITNSVFSGNGAVAGGGALAASSRQVTLANDRFVANYVTSGRGGALLLDSPSEHGITGSTFTGNFASEGGGAIDVAGDFWTLSLSGDTFGDNHVTRVPDCQGCADEWRGGGAIWAGGDHGRLLVDDGLFTANRTVTPYGGALAIAGPFARVTRTTFTANNGGSVGGGIWLSSSHEPGGQHLEVLDSTFTANIAGAGGGIGLEGGFDANTYIDVSGSTFDHNETAAALWALNGPGGRVSVVNSTFGANGDEMQVGAISVWGGFVDIESATVVSPGAAITLVAWDPNVVTTGFVANSVLVGSGAVCAGLPVNDAGGNVVWGGGGCPGTMLYADPRLGPLASNGGPTQTMALLLGSPAIDHAGDGAPAVDQRGVVRPQGPAADSGAYEKQ